MSSLDKNQAPILVPPIRRATFLIDSRGIVQFQLEGQLNVFELLGILGSFIQQQCQIMLTRNASNNGERVKHDYQPDSNGICFICGKPSIEHPSEAEN
jgi:hypothetical protein